MQKKESRKRRAQKTRGRISTLAVNRLCVHRTPRHIYAQIISPNGSEVLASASTLDKGIKKKVKYGGNIDAATIVGKILGERAKKVGLLKSHLIGQASNIMEG